MYFIIIYLFVTVTITNVIYNFCHTKNENSTFFLRNSKGWKNDVEKEVLGFFWADINKSHDFVDDCSVILSCVCIGFLKN